MDTDSVERAGDSPIVNPVAEPSPSKPEPAASITPEPEPAQSEDALAAAVSHREQEAVAAYRDEQAAAFKTLTQQTWVNEIKADQEFGGDKFTSTVIEVKRAADRFLSPEDRDTLNKTGWGNHPLLVKAFARIGRAMGNDTFVNGAGGGSGERDNSLEGRAARIYSNDGKGPST